MPEIVFESPERQLLIERHASPPPGFVDLLSRVIWGTGAVRYTMRDVPERITEFAGSHFLALRERGALVGTYVLAPRTLRVAGHTIPAMYRTLLAVAPGRGQGGLGEVLVRAARRWMLEQADGPFMTYGFIEAENAASLAVAERAGHEAWGAFVAAPFTRWHPRDDGRVEEELAPSDASPGDNLGAVVFEGGPGQGTSPRFVLREAGEVVASARAVQHHWALHGLGGVSGFVARSVLPRTPGLRRLLDPDDLRFAFFGSVAVAPGCEPLLARLLEAVLARWNLYAGMVYLDPRGRSHAALRQSGLGLLHGLGVRPRVHVMGSAVRLSAEVAAALREQPFVLHFADDV
jgi:RimJ/RimL family protein N-acetyltransferase